MLKKYHTLAYIMEINRILPLLSTVMVDIENGAGKVSEKDAAAVLVKMIKETNFVGRIKYYSELFYGTSKSHGKVTYSRVAPVSCLSDAIGYLLEIGGQRLKADSLTNKYDEESMEHAISVIEMVCEDAND